MVWPVFGSVKTGRPVSQQRFGGAADMLEDGDGLRALFRATGAAAVGAESGLDGSGGLISYLNKRKESTTTESISFIIILNISQFRNWAHHSIFFSIHKLSGT